MAKYVCDFEQVNSIGEKLCQAASDVSSSVDSYSSRIDGDLTPWTGVAKKSFETTNTEQVEVAQKDAKYINALGEFIKEAATSIQKVEDELANLKI